MSATPREVGSTANTYEILAKLAEGGMAEIFLARGESVAGVERYVVLKRILRDRADDVELVRMFLDEARLAAQLQHPNVAQVFDVGRLGESYFFTMEYVHGETLRALVHSLRALGKPMPMPCVLAIAAGAAAGLHHAHERKGVGGKPLGIVHRDISPSNLMVSYEGHVKVVDFGVAKAADRAHQSQAGTLKGKIAYLSPEQCTSKTVDRRSDLFALGIVLWELITSEGLYRRESDFLAMTAIVDEPPPAPSSRRPGVSPEIDALVLRLLAKDPADRYQTARELVDGIDAVAELTGASLTPGLLTRFMRECFGDKVEPWVDLEALPNPSVVTVRSEPIPKELALISSSIDEQLKAVVNLTLPPLDGDDDARPTLLDAPVAPTAPTVAHARPARASPAPATPPRPAAPAAPTTPRPAVARGTLVRAGIALAASVALGALVVLVVRSLHTEPAGRAVTDPRAIAPVADAGSQAATVVVDAALPTADHRDAAVVVDAAPRDASPARDAGTIRDALHHPRPPSVRHVTDAGGENCASDPMACQK